MSTATPDSATRVRLAAGIVIASVAAYTIAVFWAGLPDVLAALGRLDGELYVLLIALTGINHAFRFLRWRWLLAALQPAPPTRRMAAVYLYGLAFLATPARAGEAVRSWFLKKDGIPYTDSLAVLFLERIYDVLTMACLSVLAFPYVEPAAAMIIGSVALLLPLLLIRVNRVFDVLVRAATRSPLRRRVDRLGGFRTAIAALLVPPRPQIAVLTGLAGFTLPGVGFYVIVTALGADVSLWVGVGIYALSVTIGSFSLLPGGLGPTEAVMGALLTLLGMAAPDTVTAIVLSRLTTLWFAVAAGAAAFAVRRSAV